DTDGITATATMVKFLQSLNVDVDYFIPNRFIDGYGLTIETLEKVLEKKQPHLMITVDCGITAVNEVEYLKNRGIEVIVTDHHERGEEIPDCLIIDPKCDVQYPFRHLCGAGVALKIVQAMAGVDVASQYFSITALATISDIVDLVDENRVIVSLGLKDSKNLPLGIKKLMSECGISSPVKASDIAYKLAPKINASGRMGEASTSLELYLETNPRQISKICSTIFEYKTKRKKLFN
ncbi:MAG: DHH family phosphoesterase, partial [Clostridia bacterium]|nr:DHH family phosphoesterase [Clostridia bacterium]